MVEEDSKPPLSEEELEIVLSGPAVLINKIYTTALPAGLRITFCENRGDEKTNRFRSAVVISYVDVPSFIELLQRFMERVEFKFEVKPQPETKEEEGG